MASVIKGIPHLECFVAEPQFCTLSYGHRIIDIADKMAANATLAPSDTSYQFTYDLINGSARPRLRFMEFASVFALDADQVPEDNGVLGSTAYEWLVTNGDDWAEAIPQGQITQFVHFTNGAPDASGIAYTNGDVPANCSFVIPLFRYGVPDSADVANNPPTVEITFGGRWQICLFNMGVAPELRRYDTAIGQWTTVSKGPAGMFSINQMDYVTVQIIDRFIYITNGVQSHGNDVWLHYDPDPPFVIESYSNSRSELIPKPVITLAAPIYVAVRNQMSLHAFWYLEHANNAQIQSPKSLTDQYYRRLPLNITEVRAECSFRVTAGQSGDCAIQLQNFGVNGFYYIITVTTDDTRFTPFLYEAQIQVARDRQPIFRSPLRQISIASERVEHIDLQSTVEQTTGSLTLNNWGGTFRNVTGVHGIALDMAWHLVDEATLSPFAVPRAYGNNIYRKFTGFFQKSNRDRTSPTDSKMHLPLVSRQVMVEDAIAVNLPIFDGACEIYSMLEILYRAGLNDEPSDPVISFNPTSGSFTTVYTTPGILAWQNPWFGNYQTLRGYWGSFGYDPGSSRECRLGLCNHPILPSSAWNAPPKLKFEMGTRLWDCLMEIRRHSLPWIFFNNWGNCVIFHAFRQDLRNTMYNWFYQPIGTFREIPNSTPFDTLGYNEFHSLGIDLDTEHIRNAVLGIGLDEDQLIPIMSMYKQDLRNGDTFNYIPWYKWHLARSPFWNNAAHVNAVALNLFLRARRSRPEVSMSGWGQPGVFPYSLVEFLEGTPEVGSSREVFPDELYNASRLYRVVAVHDQMDFVNKRYTMNLTSEWMDALSVVYFDPIV